MKSDYTLRERKRIDKGFIMLHTITERSHRDEYDLREAFRNERRERSSAYVAKALLIEGFLDGYRGKVATLHALHGYAEGIAKLIVIGAAYAAQGLRYPERYGVNETMLGVLVDAVCAHQEASKRRLDAIMAR